MSQAPKLHEIGLKSKGLERNIYWFLFPFLLILSLQGILESNFQAFLFNYEGERETDFYFSFIKKEVSHIIISLQKLGLGGKASNIENFIRKS